MTRTTLGSQGSGSLETFLFRHRLTFANVICSVIVGGVPLEGALAIRNDSCWQKRKRCEYGAIGGGARIFRKGRELLLTDDASDWKYALQYDDIAPGEDVDGDEVDARITVLATNADGLEMRKHFLLGAVLRFAAWKADDLLETMPCRELREELFDDFPGILTEDQLAGLTSELIGYHVGPDRQSTRGGGGLMTTPVALCHRLIIPSWETCCALLADPLRRVIHLSPEEVATTNGGTTEGRTSHGYPIFTNVFDPSVVMRLPTLQ